MDMKAKASCEGHSAEIGRVFLRKAVENSMLDLVNTLLNQGVLPTAHELGELLLLCGSLQDIEKAVQIVEALLSVAPAEASSLGEQIFTAASSGWTRILKVLTNKANSVCDWQDSQGRTPMLMAASARHLDSLVVLLNAGADHSLPD